jgi:hypothetical protein
LKEFVKALEHSTYLVGQSSGFIAKLLVAECEPGTWLHKCDQAATKFPSGAKALDFCWLFSARLKSCPFKPDLCNQF